MDDGYVIPDHEDSKEESAVEITSRNSFIPHEAQEREGSLDGSKGGEEVELDRKVSIDGIINHIYEKPPVPSFEEFQRRDDAGPRLQDEDEDTEVESADERTLGNSPEGSRRGGELVHDKKISIDGVTNRLYENTPNEFDHSFVEIGDRDKAPLYLEERRSSSSSSSSSDSDVESVELAKEFNPVINQEDVSCVIEDEPLEGALPSNSDDATAARRTEKVRVALKINESDWFPLVFYLRRDFT